MPAAEHCTESGWVRLDRQAAHSLYLCLHSAGRSLSVFGGLPLYSQNAKCEIDSGAVAVEYHCSAISCVVVFVWPVSQCNDSTALLRQ